MFKPRKGQKYFMINSRFDVKQTENTGSQKAQDRIAVGNCFKTENEAKAFSYLVKQGAKGNFVGFKRRWWGWYGR